MINFSVTKRFRWDAINEFARDGTRFVINNTVERLVSRMQEIRWKGVQDVRRFPNDDGNMPVDTGFLRSSLVVSPGGKLQGAGAYVGVDYFDNGFTTIGWTASYAAVQHAGGPSPNLEGVIIKANAWMKGKSSHTGYVGALAHFKEYLGKAADSWKAI